uniref:Branchpoint-bridging protein n=2 Tax=Corethron hystrix TaxID=216773 RepID=A0A7S1BE61_9STRA|mmetsp:Transcript_24178/g.54974  ORF Transcript_24178/g.54974 Transcript_24178/m.54974 type:complete len:412 (+) Transcript_24178:347-1582(+)
MEEKTNCKIAIRGRGSVKEGARGRRDGKPMEGENEDLHVVVTGETQADVDKAAGLVQEMLVVIDDDKNEHKQAQLRELALLNGTLKEDDYCQFCAERGHRAFECPKRFAAASAGRAAAQVRCAICGDTSHPTRDCTQSKCIVKDEKQLDSAYQSFMAELDGKDGAEAAASASAAAAAAAAGEICRNVGAEPMTAEEIIAAVQQARGAESEAPQVFDFTDVKTVPGATAGVDGALATDEASSPPEVFDLSNLSKLKESVEAARKAEEEAAEAAANAPVAPGSEAAAVPGEDPGPSLTAAAATAALAGQAAATATPAGYPPGYPPGYSPAGTAGVQPAPMAGGYPSYEQYGPQGAGPYGPSAGGWPPGQQNYYGYPQGDAPGQPQQPQQGTGTWDYQSFYQGENMDAAVNWWD